MRDATKARLARILELVETGETAVEALSAILGVSASTVRRDLANLRQEGLITRTYGGALLPGHSHEPTISERHLEYRREKEAIAARAAEYVNDGDTIFLDGGTTVGYLLRRLIRDED